MTSRISNLNKIKSYLESLKQEYKDLNIDSEEIEEHLDQMDSGNGLKIMNSISSNSMGVFLFNSNGFKVLVDEDGNSNLYKISDELAIDMMRRYYVCRFLSKVPKYYDDVILQYNSELNNFVLQAANC